MFFRFLLSVSLLFVLSCQANAQVSNNIRNYANSTVFIMTKHADGKVSGYGTVIGNGRYIVTAQHVISENSESGKHVMPGIITVISPYTAECCYAKIVGTNPNFDIAVLEVPWFGHPSISLASNEQLKNMELANFVVYDHTSPGKVKTESLELDSILCRKGQPLLLKITGKGRLGHGWSGCPVLTPDGYLAGCFAKIFGKKESLKLNYSLAENDKNYDSSTYSLGGSVEVVREILSKANIIDEFAQGKNTLPKDDKANIAYSHLIKAFDSSEETIAQEKIIKYLEYKPNSGIAKTLLIDFSNTDTPLEKTVQFKKVIDDNPDLSQSFYALIKYGQLLSEQGKLKQANEIYAQAQIFDQNIDLVDILIAQNMTEMDLNPAEIQKLNALFEKYNSNARMLMIKAMYHLKKQELKIATIDCLKAISLWPEGIIQRKLLFHIYRESGKTKEALNVYEDIVQLEPQNPSNIYSLTLFNKENNTDKSEELQTLADTIKSDADMGNWSKQKSFEYLDKLKAILTN